MCESSQGIAKGRVGHISPYNNAYENIDMADVILDTIGSGYNLSKINNNFTELEQKINQEVLHLTGGNNLMQQAIDANSNRIINLPNAINNSEPATLGQVLENANSLDTVDSPFVTLNSDVRFQNLEQLKDFVKQKEVPSFAALSALSSVIDSLEAGDRISIYSPATPGINGEGVLINDPAHGITDTEGVEVRLNDDWYWKRTFSGPVYINWWGAVGDYNTGTETGTDNSDAIQAAINYVYNKLEYGEVRLDPGRYMITRPIILPLGVSLVGNDLESRGASRQHSIYKTTNTLSTVQAIRSTTATNANDGYDGVDHFPDCFVHCTENLTTEGVWSGRICGIFFDTPSSMSIEHGIYGRRSSSCSIKYNFIQRADTSIIFTNTYYLGEICYNYYSNCARGCYLDASTSMNYHGNYANNFSMYGHKGVTFMYCSIMANACDDGAEGDTATYAVAYDYNKLIGCNVSGNGCEGLNGIFIRAELCQGTSIHDNICIGYELSYTGPDIIGAIYLDSPVGSFRRNKVVFETPVAYAADHYNLYVESVITDSNFEWGDDNYFVNSNIAFPAQSLTPGLPEGFAKSSTFGNQYGYGAGVYPRDKSFFVRTSGSDNNNGNSSSSGEALLTVQAVIDRLPKQIESTLTIDIGTGTFDAFEIKRKYGTGKIIIQGNGVANTTISGNILINDNDVIIEIIDCEITNTGSVVQHISVSNSEVIVRNCEYNTAATGSSNQFVTAGGNSRVSVYNNTYTTTTGANLIRANDSSLIITDSGTAGAVGRSQSNGGTILTSGVS